MTHFTRTGNPNARRSPRGFTLIELLVALTGGLFVSVAVFAIARDASRFYQRESRAANATLAVLSGFERLRGDIARAGFLATPNIQADPFVCRRPGAGAPPLLQRLRAIRIVNGGSPTNTALTANSLAPDSVILAGSYSAPDAFPVEIASEEGNTYHIELKKDSPALARLGYRDATNAAERLAVLSSVFAAKRAVRIVDREGRQHYGLISSVDLGSTGLDPKIILSNTVPIQFKKDTAALCGVAGNGTGALINVVNFIRYDLRTLPANGTYVALFSARSGLLGEATRTELVRAELDPSAADEATLFTVGNAAPIEELVAEYAVDLDFGVTSVAAGSANPTLTQLDFGNNGFANLTDNGASPQLIRAVRVRLAVRSREADRSADVPAMPDVAPGLYRFLVGNENGPRYARVRTLQADINLQNLKGLQW